MSVVEIASVAAAGIVGLGLLVAIWQVFVTQTNERRRTQPVVVAHQDRGRIFGQAQGGWTVQAHATNEGEGAAYNVRWGVSFYGVRFAYRLDEKDPVSGNRFRVIHPRESVPPDGSWDVVVSSVEMWGGDGVPEEGAFYWARYENAQGRTWETINSPDRSKGLEIRWVRFVRLRERLEGRSRRRFRVNALEKEKVILAELLQSRGK